MRRRRATLEKADHDHHCIETSSARFSEPRRAARRRLRRVRDHRRPRQGDDVPLAVPARAPRAAELPDRRRGGRRLDARRPARARAEGDRGGRRDRSTRPCSTASSRGSHTWRATSADAETFERLAAAIGDAELPVFYLEIPPFLFGTVIDGLAAGRADQERARRRREAVRARPRRRPASSTTRSTSTSTSRSCTGSTTSSARWASRRSSTCGSRTRCSSRSGTATTSRRSRSRWPRASASRTAATSTTPSARSATSSSTT